MSAPILLYLPDDLLNEVNKRVASAKAADSIKRKLTKAEKEKANTLAKTKGRAAADRYIGSLNRNIDKRRSSRVRILQELISVGLKHTKH